MYIFLKQLMRADNNIYRTVSHRFCRLFKLDEAAQINLSLAVFNLLPVTMLDGGKILSSFVTERTIRIIGITIGIILSFLGAAVAIYTRRNFLILVVSLYVLIGAIK